MLVMFQTKKDIIRERNVCHKFMDSCTLQGVVNVGNGS